jgi:molybdopterin-guanine dinucleotide biosynthesis protein A
MFDVDGFILVGGASSRMGADKSQLDFGGQTAVACIALALESLAARISVVGAGQGNENGGFPNVPDLRPRWGALGGIHAALNACEAEWAAIVACDLLFVTPKLFARLLLFATDAAVATAAAIVPIQPDGRPQPLCALYRREPCLKETARLIGEGEHAPRALLAAVRTRWVESSELSDLPGADNFFFNANTPEDYELAKRILALQTEPSK